MILVDTGPIVALINARDADHIVCRDAARNLSDSHLLTTWPCFTEAMYFLYREGGVAFQDALWQYRTSGVLDLHSPSIQEEGRMKVLMAKYSDSPMDLADASLVVAAETFKISTIFSIDSHFRAYRLSNGHVLNVIP